MMTMFLIMFLVIIILLTSYIVFKPQPQMIIQSSFECGFSSFSPVRLKFSPKFFKFLILFLLFDGELCLLLPILIYGEKTGIIYPLTLLSICMILLVALMHEWVEGALNW